MKFHKLFFILIFLHSKAFCNEIQYFLSPYFYQNPHSYSINGMQYYKFNIGELMDAAINKSKKFHKCNNQINSGVILYLFPITFYNPRMEILYSELNVRIYDNGGENKKNFLVKYQELIKLNQNGDKQITDHYIELINLMYERLQDFNLKKTPLINGNICKVFN